MKLACHVSSGEAFYNSLPKATAQTSAEIVPNLYYIYIFPADGVYHSARVASSELFVANNNETSYHSAVQISVSHDVSGTKRTRKEQQS